MRAELLQTSALRSPFATVSQIADAVSVGNFHIIVRKNQAHFAMFLQEPENFQLAVALTKHPADKVKSGEDGCDATWKNPNRIYVESEISFIYSCMHNKDALDHLLEVCIDSVPLFSAFAFPRSATKYRERVSRATEFLYMDNLRKLHGIVSRRELIKTFQKNMVPNQKQAINVLAMQQIFIIYFSVSCTIPLLVLLFEKIFWTPAILPNFVIPGCG